MPPRYALAALLDGYSGRTVDGSGAAARLEQEPGALFGLVDPVVGHRAGRGVAGSLGGLARFADALDELQIVVTQLGQHLGRRDIIAIVVGDRLAPRDVPDRAQRRGADLAHALGDVVGHRDD